MFTWFRSPAARVAACVGSLGLFLGCASKPKSGDFFTPYSTHGGGRGDQGSIADMKRKMETPPTTAKTPPARPSSIDGEVILSVSYDARGQPVFAEVQRTSGDAALDAEAQATVLKRAFPAGRADTVVVTIPVRGGKLR